MSSTSSGIGSERGNSITFLGWTQAKPSRYHTGTRVPQKDMMRRWLWIGALLVALGPERIVWGTDCAWYGSPQPLIDAFRAFVIPDDMQLQFGYPPLTTDAKERILSTNAQALYGFSAAPRVDGAWAANAAVELQRAIAAAGLASGGAG